jgi:hypothetical protein
MSGDPIEQFARLAALGETDVFDDLDSLAQVRARRSRPTPADKRPRPVLGRLYVKLPWSTLAEGMQALSTGHDFRLWLLLNWQARVETPKDGWLLPRTYMLEKLGLRGANYSHVVERLERSGVVEVQRRGRKKALLRLVRKGARP